MKIYNQSSIIEMRRVVEFRWMGQGHIYAVELHYRKTSLDQWSWVSTFQSEERADKDTVESSLHFALL